MIRSFLALASALTLSLSAGFALRLPGPALVDRSAVQPLREANLAAALDGNGADVRWREAAAKLPARCQDVDAPPPGDCSDQLRCAWLGARAAALAASGQAPPDRARVAEALHRLAQRLSAPDCRPGDDRWRSDARQAALDDAMMHVALLKDATLPAWGPVLPPDEQRRCASLIEQAKAGGVASVPVEALLAARMPLRRNWERRSWLARSPALGRLRVVVAAAWSPIGDPPRDCGGDLLRPDLLEDQWRGYLVREAAPGALACLRSRLIPALAARGLGVVDRAAVELTARQLEEAGRQDVGGRVFVSEPEILRRIERLSAALQVRSAAADAAQPRRASSGPSAPRSAGGRERPAVSRRGGAPAVAGLSAGAATLSGGPDAALARLIRDVARFADAGRLHGAAARAASGAERAQIERLLLVELHRAVCAPLDDADPEDLDAVRRALARRRVTADEQACDGGEGRRALESLVQAAPALTKLGAAARLRAAARLAALGQADEARRQIESVPVALRGITWTVLAAWTARLNGDPVEASRLLGRLDPEALDRLRSSADEELARLATHASAPTP